MRHLAVSLTLLLSAAPLFAVRSTLSFDSDWRFLKSDAPGAEQPDFNDADWRILNLPHDWSIEGPFDRENPTGPEGAFLPAGIGWYRRHFTLAPEQAKRRVIVEFDGVMANSEVWINGFRLGKRPSGYVSFRYDLTGHLKFGRDVNVIAARADNSQQPASRWYAGAGIYRHVRMLIEDPVHVEADSLFITSPKIDAAEATVHVAGSIINQSDAARPVSLEISILGPTGKTVKTADAQPLTAAPGKSAAFQQDLVIAKPERWDLGHPALYRALVKVKSGKDTLDDAVAPFGIREFHFDAATGFWLNGRNFKLKGACLHGDGGAVGTAVPVRVWERRLDQLREIGVNAVRAAHNPPAPDFLDLCDRMGFLVMDEMFDAWTVGKSGSDGKSLFDYHLYFRDWSRTDTEDTVRRDRNHPSIILYSAGNEIHDTPNAPLAHQILEGLVSVFHANDPTRPVTQALFRPNVSHDYDNGLADLLDVVGQNYRENEILAAHEAKPTRKIVGTENTHDRRAWLALRDNAPYAGQFLWAGIDYLGEAPGWPAVASYSGLLDKTGAIKPNGWERASWWSEKPMVHMVRRVAPRQASPTDPGYEGRRPIPQETLFDDWTPADSSPHQETVEIYSNCPEVELLLNGKSLGSEPLHADASPRTFHVAFEPGTLRASCKSGPAYELRTAGKPVRIVLSTDRNPTPAWDDLAFVTATVVDENGVTVPSATPVIAFKTEGPGAVVATDNADNTSHESFQSAERRAFHGWCIALVRMRRAGRMFVTAASEGLTSEPLALDGR